MTLREYFLSTFAPDRLVGKNLIYAHQYLSAITCLEISKGMDLGTLLLHEVTDDDLDAMKAKCIAEEYAPVTVTKYRWLLRTVLRHARPDEFQSLSGRHKRTSGDVELIDEPGTLWHFYQHVYQLHRLLGRTMGTKEQFEIAIRNVCTFRRNGRLSVLDLTDDLLMDVAQEMNGDGLANATINGRLAKLRALWRFAVRRKLRLNLPDNERLSRLKRLPTAWQMSQMGRLLQAVQGMYPIPQRPVWPRPPRPDDGMVGGIPAAKFWTAFLLVLYDSGIRVNSCLQLPFDCLDLETHWLTAPAEIMKSGNEQRFYLHEQTVAAVAAIRGEPRSRLFPWTLHKRTLYKRFRKLLQRAQLADTRRDLFHKIRRTSATHLAAAVGIEQACRHLGHSALWVTQGYLDPTMMPAVKAGAILPRPIMPEGGAT